VSDRNLRAVIEISERIKPLLAGKPPEVQGTVLAELLATWLGGHRVAGHPPAQAALREDLLDRHIATVRALLDAADREAPP
jgi:hypothetical protein